MRGDGPRQKLKDSPKDTLKEDLKNIDRNREEIFNDQSVGTMYPSEHLLYP